MEQGSQWRLKMLQLVLTASSDALVASPQKHNGAIKALQFNPKHSNLLATGGMKGEACLSLQRQYTSRYSTNCMVALRHGLEQRREPIPSWKRRSCRRHRMLGLE